LPNYVYHIGLLTIFLLSRGVVLAAQAQSQPANVTIAYTSISPQYAPVWIAKEAGFSRTTELTHSWSTCAVEYSRPKR
jgi:ABC-type nitrate/sulfonate/bicarbonate transport system substrate-binding protein